ncbi:MAG TPA: amidohydrolase family protein [Burkholderiales bacterium]|nr:amidohydrolase family protein [Burkholderiales bacterium]
MTRILFTNCKVLDCTGASPFSGSVLVEGERIHEVWRAQQTPRLEDARAIDGKGATLMPGLIEPHAHITFTDCAQSVDMGFIPVEEHLLIALRNARTMLDAGFTSCLSAASAKKRLDIVLRNAIDRGEFPGPRMLAASPEMTVTGGLGDVRLPHLYRENFAVVLDGADEFRRFAREMCRDGVDTLKINISGDAGTPAAPADRTVMSEAEIHAVCDVAHDFGKRVAAHARSAESVKRCLHFGVPILYHATLLDQEAKDMLSAARDTVFVAPTLGNLYATLYEAGAWGMSVEAGRARGLEHELEQGIATMKDLRRRGVRILPGGDYGFAWNPIGANARDVEHFVKLLGFTPLEAILAATRLGGEIMQRGHELGQVRPGYLADLLLLDGDPLADVGVLRQRERLRMVMKGGAIHARCEP